MRLQSPLFGARKALVPAVVLWAAVTMSPDKTVALAFPAISSTAAAGPIPKPASTGFFAPSILPPPGLLLDSFQGVSSPWTTRGEATGFWGEFGIRSLRQSWRPAPIPELAPGIRTVSRGNSVEVLALRTGLAVRAGQLSLPTSPEMQKLSYFVFDHRPTEFLTAVSDRENDDPQFRVMGVQASYRPHTALAFTLGAYNNKASYRPGTLIVKDALTRVDIDLGIVQGGGFYYYGTGRWLGDRTKAGFDLRTRLGPVEVSGQILHGTSYGVEQLGWYAALNQSLSPTTTLVWRVDQHNPNLRRTSGPASHAVLALVQRLSKTQAVRVNIQIGLSDSNRAPVLFGPSNWALIGQLHQRF